MIYLYLFGTCFHFIYVFMIIGNNNTYSDEIFISHINFGHSDESRKTNVSQNIIEYFVIRCYPTD